MGTAHRIYIFSTRAFRNEETNAGFFILFANCCQVTSSRLLFNLGRYSVDPAQKMYQYC